MTRRWSTNSAHGKPAARIVQRSPYTADGRPLQCTRVVVTVNGHISEDTLACVRRLVQAGLV